MPDGTLLAIAGSRLSATVSTEGAELSTLVDARAGDLLSDGDPRFWTGRAPLLFPIVGRLADDALRVGGRTYTLPQHGFARRRRFDVVEHGPASVTLRLSSDAETLAVFPFAFRLDARFAIEGDVLEMSMRVENTGAAPLPLAFGFHPAFRWPLPYGGAREAHEIEFEADEDAPIRRPYPDGLLTPPAPSPVAGRRLALSDALFADGALVMTRLASRRLVYGVAGRTRLAIGFPDTPHLGLWSKPGAGAPFVCVEPWQGHADEAGFSGDVWERPGVVAVEPGGARSIRMTVAPLDPAVSGAPAAPA